MPRTRAEPGRGGEREREHDAKAAPTRRVRRRVRPCVRPVRPDALRPCRGRGVVRADGAWQRLTLQTRCLRVTQATARTPSRLPAPPLLDHPTPPHTLPLTHTRTNTHRARCPPRPAPPASRRRPRAVRPQTGCRRRARARGSRAQATGRRAGGARTGTGRLTWIR